MDVLSPVLGALGGIGSHVFGFLKARSDNAHEERMARIRIDERKAEADATVQVAVQEAKGAEAKASWGAFRDSYRLDSKVVSGDGRPKWADGLLACVDVLRLSQRPLLIWAVLGVAVYFHTDFGQAEFASMLKHLVALSVGWLFGERGTAFAVDHHSKASFASRHPAAAAWGVSPEAFAQLEADQKKAG